MSIDVVMIAGKLHQGSTSGFIGQCSCIAHRWTRWTRSKVFHIDISSVERTGVFAALSWSNMDSLDSLDRFLGRFLGRILIPELALIEWGRPLPQRWLSLVTYVLLLWQLSWQSGVAKQSEAVDWAKDWTSAKPPCKFVMLYIYSYVYIYTYTYTYTHTYRYTYT